MHCPVSRHRIWPKGHSAKSWDKSDGLFPPHSSAGEHAPVSKQKIWPKGHPGKPSIKSGGRSPPHSLAGEHVPVSRQKMRPNGQLVSLPKPSSLSPLPPHEKLQVPVARQNTCPGGQAALSLDSSFQSKLSLPPHAPSNAQVPVSRHREWPGGQLNPEGGGGRCSCLHSPTAVQLPLLRHRIWRWKGHVGLQLITVRLRVRKIQQGKIKFWTDIDARGKISFEYAIRECVKHILLITDGDFPAK